jgi:hypothetical protein
MIRLVPFGVHLRHVGLAVAEDHLRGLQAKPLTDLGAQTVAELVRMPPIRLSPGFQVLTFKTVRFGECSSTCTPNRPKIGCSSVAVTRLAFGFLFGAVRLAGLHFRLEFRSQFILALPLRLQWRETVGRRVAEEVSRQNRLRPWTDGDGGTASVVFAFVARRPVQPDIAASVDIARPDQA